MCNKIRNRFYLLFVIFLTIGAGKTSVCAQLLNGFKQLESFNEQEKTIHDSTWGVTMAINAPLHFLKHRNTKIIFYALPNGNSIEWTKGKVMKDGDDWHYDIQHISAQLRMVRKLDKKIIT